MKKKLDAYAKKRRNIVDLLTNFKKLTMVNTHSLDYCF